MRHPALERLRRHAVGSGHRAELLEQSKWSAGLDWKDIVLLAEHTEVYRAPVGSVICKEGEVENFLALILEGEVAVVKDNSSGHQTQIAVLGPNRLVGELALLDDGPRSATVLAREDVVLLIMTTEDFDRLAEKHSHVALKVLRRVAGLLSQKLRQLSGQIVDFLG